MYATDKVGAQSFQQNVGRAEGYQETASLNRLIGELQQNLENAQNCVTELCEEHLRLKAEIDRMNQEAAAQTSLLVAADEALAARGLVIMDPKTGRPALGVGSTWR